jgi:hypothetical protein
VLCGGEVGQRHRDRYVGRCVDASPSRNVGDDISSAAHSIASDARTCFINARRSFAGSRDSGSRKHDHTVPLVSAMGAHVGGKGPWRPWRRHLQLRTRTPATCARGVSMPDFRARGSRSLDARSSRSACWNAISLRSNFASSSSTARMKCSRGVLAIRSFLIMTRSPESAHDRAMRETALGSTRTNEKTPTIRPGFRGNR